MYTKFDDTLIDNFYVIYLNFVEIFRNQIIITTSRKGHEYQVWYQLDQNYVLYERKSFPSH